jgi:hypothetical protein
MEGGERNMAQINIDKVKEIRITDISDYADVSSRYILIKSIDDDIKIRLTGIEQYLKIDVSTSREEKV